MTVDIRLKCGRCQGELQETKQVDLMIHARCNHCSAEYKLYINIVIAEFFGSGQDVSNSSSSVH